MGYRKSVIIVGAGASQEAGLPVGSGLKKEISRILKYREPSGSMGVQINDDIIHSALTTLSRNGHDINQLYRACKHISNAMPQAISIDNFIDTHKENEPIEKCGKLAIVHSILKAEQNSKLYFNQKIFITSRNMTN